MLVESHKMSSESGWFSVLQLWDKETLPVVPSIFQLRMAVIAPLPNRPHSNPSRATLGDMDFFYVRELMSNISTVSLTAIICQAKCADLEVEDLHTIV